VLSSGSELRGWRWTPGRFRRRRVGRSSRSPISSELVIDIRGPLEVNLGVYGAGPLRPDRAHPASRNTGPTGQVHGQGSCAGTTSSTRCQWGRLQPTEPPRISGALHSTGVDIPKPRHGDRCTGRRVGCGVLVVKTMINGPGARAPLRSRCRTKYREALAQAAVLGVPGSDLFSFSATHPVSCAGVDLGPRHPPAHRLLPQGQMSHDRRHGPP